MKWPNLDWRRRPSVEASIKYKNALSNLEQSFTNLGRAVGTDLMPIISTYMDMVTAWLANPENKQWISDEMHEGITHLGEALKAIITTFHDWHGAAEALALYIGGRWLLAMTVGLGPVGIAVAAIAAGFFGDKKPAWTALIPAPWTADSPLWTGGIGRKPTQISGLSGQP